VSQLLFDEVAGDVGEIPENADVFLTHRFLDSRGTGWKFGSTFVDFNGRARVVERSTGRFFAILMLIAAAPVLPWGAAALASLCFHPRRPPS